MGASIRQSAKYTGTTAQTNMTFTLGLTPLVGNRLVFIACFYTGDDPVLTPSGWTLKQNYEPDSSGVTVFYRDVQTGDGTSWNLNVLSSADQNSGFLIEVTGHDPTNFFNQIGNSTATGTPSSLASASVTPSVLNCLAIAAFVNVGSGGTDTAAFSSGWTEQQYANSTFQPAWLSARTALTSDTTTAISDTISTMNGGGATASSVIFLIAPATSTAPNTTIGQSLPGQAWKNRFGRGRPYDASTYYNAIATPIPALSTLQDDFQFDDQIDPLKWSNSGGSQIYITDDGTNHWLNLASILAGNYVSITSNPIFDMGASSIFSQVLSAGNQAITSWEVYPVLVVDSIKPNVQVTIRISGNVVAACQKTGGSLTIVGSTVPYNSATMQWFRIREQSGTTYWEYSADCVSWTQIASSANPMQYNSVFGAVQIGTWQAESSTTVAQIDNINVAPGSLQVAWSGYVWNKRVKMGASMFNNNWLPANVGSPDVNGYLPISISNPTGYTPYGAEIFTQNKSFGYGTYIFQVGTEDDNLHYAIVFGGLFLFDFAASPDYKEIDVDEIRYFSGNPGQILKSHVWNNGGSATFITDNVSENSSSVRTYRLIWGPDGLTFDSFIGAGTGGTNYQHSVHTTHLPTAGSERAHINIWVQNANNPSTATPTTISLQSFSYTPNAPVIGTMLPGRTWVNRFARSERNVFANAYSLLTTVTTTQTILGKARIQAVTNQTILGLARITATTLQTVLGKARITATTVQTIQGKARITATTVQTILGKTRITATTPQTIPGKARITDTTLQTILGKARITATTVHTILGVARITATTLQTILGKARLTNTTTQTQPGKSRIQVTTPQTQPGKARITNTTLWTILGLARVMVTTVQTIAGKSRVQVSTTQTIQGRANIAGIVPGQVVGNMLPGQTWIRRFAWAERHPYFITTFSKLSIQTILGLARIQVTTLRTIQGVARITVTTTRTIQGLARITATTVQTILGKARLTATTVRTQLGKSRITVVTLQVILGKARITNTSSQTQPGKSRLTNTTLQLQTGKSRITVTSLQTTTGKSRLTDTTLQTTPGRSRITATTLQTLSGKSRIQALTSRLQQGISRIMVSALRAQVGRARIQNATIQTIQGIAHIIPRQTVTNPIFLGQNYSSITLSQNNDSIDINNDDGNTIYL